MEKILTQLLSKIDYIKIDGKVDTDIKISSLVFDTRQVKSGSLFFALPGTHVHGNKFICKAIELGAVAVIYQDELPEDAKKLSEQKKCIFINVKDSRFAMSPIADEFYDNPSSKMGIIGITGTEGKSSTVFFTWQLLRLVGKKAGFISTVQYSLGEEAIDNPEHQTTPEAPIIQEKLYQMLQNGCEYAVVESSSHGLSVKTNRLGDVAFDAVAMMNVTHEHLEFHGTHQQYKSDKANLFRALDKFSHTKNLTTGKMDFIPFGLVNLEDSSSQYFIQATKSKVFGFSAPGCAGNKQDNSTQTDFSEENYSGFIQATDVNSSSKTCSCKLVNNTNSEFNQNENQLKLNFTGTFNIYNALASSMLVSKLTKTEFSKVLEQTTNLIPVKGRMTTVDLGQDFEVIVDYAHTPSSFETIFPPLRKRCKGKIISLFGSGGERDTKKRSVQGQIASKWCDIVILADEDPRGEDSVELLEMIAEGCKDENGNYLKREERLFIIPDRKKAIRKAFSLCKKDDIVLLLGKAHENSIIYKDFVMPYDEISEAENALKEMGY